jgi:cold shock CspA family protein
MSSSHTRTVKFFDALRGYGFITRPGGGDLFFHAGQLDRDMNDPQKGQCVEFVVGRDRSGRPRAEMVRAAKFISCDYRSSATTPAPLCWAAAAEAGCVPGSASFLRIKKEAVIPPEDGLAAEVRPDRSTKFSREWRSMQGPFLRALV